MPTATTTLLRTRYDLLSYGMTERDIARAIADKRLVRPRRGWYTETTTWKAMWPEQRQRALIAAVARDGVSEATAVSYLSAAAQWTLPFYRLNPSRVHLTTAAPTRISSDPGVFRHTAQLSDDDVTEVDGIRCTTLERTVFDCIRMLGVEAGLALADGALRRIAADGQRYNDGIALEWIETLNDRIFAAKGARGLRTARTVARLVDGRAQLPGESVSRLQLLRLGFARPRLQVPVPGPGSKTYWIDFGLDDVNAFGEFDGKGKYTDESMRSGRSLEEVLLDEKKREDWVRGTTQRRFARWGDDHAATAPQLGARLAQFGIIAPRQ